MAQSEIVIRGAREHNLRNVSLRIPKNKLVVMTGVSGSGKSSLAFDTLYAEGQRRYVESLSSYARQFLGQMPKPEVDAITGLAPSISIQQKTSGRNPRSTVGTITEIYDYLRVLFARVGKAFCHQCGRPITAQTSEQILESVLRLPEGTKFLVLAPIVQQQKGEFRDLFDDLLKQGFLRARVDGRIVQLTDNLQLDRQMRHTIEVVVDRLVAGKAGRTRIAEAIESALRLAGGKLMIAQEAASGGRQPPEDESVQSFEATPTGPTRPGSLQAPPSADRLYSSDYACTHCGISYEPPSPQLFSFNSPQGMCLDCNGLGMRHDFLLEKLIEDDSLSIAKGAISLLGPLKEIGRWRRHLYDGAARAIEQDHGLKEGTLLKTRWRELPEVVRKKFLYGLGDRNVTFTWKHSAGVWKHGGTYSGLVNELLDGYRKTKNPMRRKQLEKYMEFVPCPTCNGSRLNAQARGVRITSRSYSPPYEGGAGGGRAGGNGSATATSTPEFTPPNPPLEQGGNRTAAHGACFNLAEVCSLSIAEAAEFFRELELDDTGRLIAEEVLKEIRGRLGFLLRCGLDYLTLDRTAPTLSGGESQRIRLAGQIGCGLVGVVYILDEPSIGLHPRDNQMLLDSLCDLRDQGNTVIVVEHDEETMRAADHLIDFGPGPGVRGGKVVAEGSLDHLKQAKHSLTGQFLSGAKTIPIPKQRRPIGEKALRIRGATHHNLKHVDVAFPLESFICVTGVSGSGKSSLVNDILWEVLNRDLNGGKGMPGKHHAVEGLEHLDKAIDIDQSPIGRTPRSNPATYIKLFDLIRDLYTELPDSKLRGYKAGRFSFNVSGGRCEACEGYGSNKLEMDFLADIWVTCPVCQGRRFNKETLEIRFKGKNIAEVLEMDVQQALEHFENHPKIKNLLQTLHDVGLDYIKLGQPSPTLSGGEAQRVKLARELGKRSTGRTVYILDEPTTGLHFWDIEHLLRVLHGFVDAGNTVIVVEHNLDVIKTADWIIDLGPEGGIGGGTIVAEGTPEEVARCEQSHTGRALIPVLSGSPPYEGGAGGGRAGGKGSSSRELTPPNPPLEQGGNRRGTNAAVANSSARWQTAAALRSNGNGRGIVVRGAAQHNLQGIDMEIPRDTMSVFCGPSGSGKSSLAMDTLYAEGQRRYVESLSAYARQFLGQMPKPKVEHIHGLSPSIAIEQKTVGHTPRSTVGTVTEIYDYLRILFARLGTQYCPDCEIPVQTQTTDEVIDKLLALPEETKLLVLAPQEIAVGQSYDKLWDRLREQGFRRVRIDGETYRLDQVPEIDRRRKHQVEVVVDRVTNNRGQRSRVADSVESAFDLGKGTIRVAHVDDNRPETQWRVDPYSLFFACEQCGRSFEELSPHNFSFNSPLGWCPTCEGLGTQQGTNLSALIGDTTRSLAEGAISAWPDPQQCDLFRCMLEAMATECGIPLDVPFSQLEPAQQRAILYGTGERWMTLDPASRGRQPPDSSMIRRKDQGADAPRSPMKFQYKGLYPAIEEAARVSFTYRLRLQELIGEVPCSNCHGSRLRQDAAAMRWGGKTLQQLCEMPLGDALPFLKSIKLSATAKKIAGDLLKEATSRMSFLVDVGLHYLTLSRALPTLSGGETQRIRLAGQIGRALTGVLYVLDEPTIGLHPSDNGRLLQALKKLRDLGNTVILVEHDREVIRAADRLYDFGPGAGRFGGTIVGEGTPEQVKRQPGSLTGQYLSEKQQITIPLDRRMPSSYSPHFEGGAGGGRAAEAEGQRSEIRGQNQKSTDHGPRTTDLTPPNPPLEQGGNKRGRAAQQTAVSVSPTPYLPHSLSPPLPLSPSPTPPGGGWLELLGARLNNLRNVDLRVPLGTLTAITGVSGSGKSSLIEDTLAKAVAKRLNRMGETPGPYDELLGLEQLSKVIVVDQQPLGNTPASNPATYTGVFELIRELFCRLPEAKVRGYRPARFSFNRPGGRCEACEGNGQKRIEMHFLPDVWVECDTCRGKRYNEETLAVTYRGHSIADVLNLSIGQAAELFENIPKIRGILATLCAIGLDYLTLGQPAPTLSGGEAQRVKLAAELAKPQSGRTLYLLDEPTTGLHFDDVRKLLKILHSLVEAGNTVVVVEHNLDVIKTADWLIDLGPGAGIEGGWIVAQGTPEDVVAHLSAPPLPKGGPGGVAPESPRKSKRKSKQPTDGIKLNVSSTSELTPPSPPFGRGGANAGMIRSLTAEALAPILATGTRAEREIFDAEAAARRRKGDVDLRQVGRSAQMPWQTDGRRWHTRDRVAHNGRPCRWEGSALEWLVEQLEQDDRFAPVNWNDRGVVEVMGAGKEGGWFLHALTGEEWLLTLKFRVHRGTFQEDDLQARLDLTDWDDLDEVPVYGRADRVRVKNLKGPWQEVTITVHWRRDIDTPAFREFLQQAIDGYFAQTTKAKLNVADLTPWKILGRKWHLSRKGFPSGKRAAWEPQVLEELSNLLAEAFPEAELDWSNQQVVNVIARGDQSLRACLHTKRRGGIDLQLVAKAGEIELGRIADLGSELEITPHRDGWEAVKIRFTKLEQVQSPALREFLSRVGR